MNLNFKKKEFQEKGILRKNYKKSLAKNVNYRYSLSFLFCRENSKNQNSVYGVS